MESRRLCFPPTRIQPRLLQPEQLEMVDQEGADQDHRPADPEGDPDEVVDHRMRNWIDAPHDRRDRPPADEQDHQRYAGGEYIDAAFGRRRHEPGPPALEALARHDAVL